MCFDPPVKKSPARGRCFQRTRIQDTPHVIEKGPYETIPQAERVLFGSIFAILECPSAALRFQPNQQVSLWMMLAEVPASSHSKNSLTQRKPFSVQYFHLDFWHHPKSHAPLFRKILATPLRFFFFWTRGGLQQMPSSQVL